MRWAVLLVCFALWCQQPNEPAPVVPQGGAPAQQTWKDLCMVEGRVVDAITGEPLKKVELILRRADGRGETVSGTASDADGAFVIKDMEPGRYFLSAERNGYLRQEYGAQGRVRPGATLTLNPGQRLRDVVFRLIPQGVVFGRATDEDGEPVANVRIMALRYGYMRGKRQLFPAGNASTNDLGEYRLHGLAPGRYLLSATYRSGSEMMFGGGDRTIGDARAEEGYAPTYYPGTNDPNSAVAVEAGPGARVPGIDFRLLKTRTVRIRGRVVNTVNDAPGTEGEIMIYLRPRPAGAFGLGDRNTTPIRGSSGRFEIRGVTPGLYTLTAVYSENSKKYTGSIPIEVSTTNVDDVSLAISAGTDLAGSVRAEGKSDINLRELQVLLDPQDGGSLFGGVSERVRPDGTFMLPNVPAGEYRVAVLGAPPAYYLKSVRMGREEALESGISISSGGAAAPLEVVLDASSGLLEGSVQNDKQQPWSNARVVLVPDPRRRSQTFLYKAATTDQYGRFTLTGIAPGEYKLFAWEELEYGAPQDPEFLKPFEKLGDPVTIRENERLTKQLTLISTESAVPEKQRQATP